VLNNFIRDISHEFRTPLAVIDSSAYILRRTEDAEKRDLLVERLTTQVNRLVRILEEILTMTELDMQTTEALSLSSVAVNELIGDVMIELAPLVDGKRLRITENLDLSLTAIPGDPERLRRAIFNVVQNAVNYTPDGGSISVQTRNIDSAQLIEVKDTGIGIEADDLIHIFERLYRADKARAIEDNGVGLGLSIAKQILVLHRGKIQAESIPGQGSLFRLILPVAGDEYARSA